MVMAELKLTELCSGNRPILPCQLRDFYFAWLLALIRKSFASLVCQSRLTNGANDFVNVKSRPFKRETPPLAG